MHNPKPITETYDGVTVVCDHLLLGGTKSRYLPLLFKDADEVVYASSCEGGGQAALAYTACTLKKLATIFVAHRINRHRRQYEARAAGAKYVEIKPAYLNVIQARAKQYCHETGAKYAGFGLGQTDDCINIVAEAADKLKIKPDHVWCSAGSGATIRGLARAWPKSTLHAVQVGHELTADDVLGAEIHVHPKKYGWFAPADLCPFPADQHYEVKAWMMMQQWRKDNPKERCLFWSVMGRPAI